MTSLRSFHLLIYVFSNYNADDFIVTNVTIFPHFNVSSRLLLLQTTSLYAAQHAIIPWISEWGLTLKVQSFACFWMVKCQFFCMKKKPLRPSSIEFITSNGVVEPLNMCTMHAKLMRPTRSRI